MRRLVVLILLAGPVAVPSDAISGQVIEGRVLDGASNRPLADVSIELLDSATRVVGRALATPERGAFAFDAPSSGIYRIRGYHLSYDTITSSEFHVPAGDTLRVEFRLSANPLELPPLRVAVVRDPRLQGWGYYQREKDYEGHGVARFFTTEELDSGPYVRLSDILRDIPQLRLVGTGRGQVEVQTRDGRRVPIFLNASYIRVRRDETYTLDQIIPLGQVGAVEVYWRHAPAEYGAGAAIVVWSR